MQKYFLVLLSLLLLPSFSNAHFLTLRLTAPTPSPEEKLSQLFHAQNAVSITQFSNRTLAGDELTKGILIRIPADRNEIAMITPKQTLKLIEIDKRVIEAILSAVKKRIKLKYTGGTFKGTEEYEILKVYQKVQQALVELEVEPAKLTWRWVLLKKKRYCQQIEKYWLSDQAIKESICRSPENRRTLATIVSKEQTLTYEEALAFVNRVYEKN